MNESFSVCFAVDLIPLRYPETLLLKRFFFSKLFIRLYFVAWTSIIFLCCMKGAPLIAIVKRDSWLLCLSRKKTTKISTELHS